ncbi:hypothetical protein MMC32_006740 [Xylographa parallela]|nr:hypothetical protein [Xylographa parallela]
MSGRGGVEVLDVLSCVTGIISTFNDTLTVVKTITQRRKAINGYPPSRFLEDTLCAGPPAIGAQINEGLERFGAIFATGDSAATVQLKDILIGLQTSCIQHLQRAQEDDTVTDFTALIKASNISRLNAVKTLCELQMRMEVAGPVYETRSDDLESRIQDWQREGSLALNNVVDPSFHQPELGHRDLSLRGGQTFGSAIYHEQNEVTKESVSELIPKPPRKQQTANKFSFLTLSASSHHRGVRTVAAEVPRHYEVPGHYESGSSSVSSGDNLRRSTSTRYSEESMSENTLVPATITTSLFFDGLLELDGPNPWADSPDESTEREHNQKDPFARLPTYEHTEPPSSRAPLRRITQPCSTNNYSGFCKGAFELQVGSDTLKRRKEMGPLSSDPVYWACPSSKCAFTGSAHRRQNDWVIDDRVRTLHGVRFRWMFLAKSHVQQKRVKHGLHNYICVFCVLQNRESPVISRDDDLMRHISQHRGERLGEAILHRTSCINDRLAADHDEFDINLVPPAHVAAQERSRSQWPPFQSEIEPSSNMIMEFPISTRAVFGPNDYGHND